MIHPDTELRFVNRSIGYGVFATRLIPRGTITRVRDRLDQAFTPAQIEAFPAHYRNTLLKYTFVDGRGEFVLCWDLARYINHSCDSTCRTAGFDFEGLEGRTPIPSVQVNYVNVALLFASRTAGRSIAT